MKYSVAALSALAAVVAAKPHFLNTSFDVTEGEPFTLEYDDCDSGCTIILETGESTALVDVKTLTSDASGSSATVTLDKLPSGTYAFKIVNNDSGEFNYSNQFPYKGTGPALSLTTSAAATETTAMSTTMAATTSMTTATETGTTMTTDQTSSAETSSAASTSSGASTTGSDQSSTTLTGPSSTPTVPDNGAARMSSPIALVGGAIAAMFFLW